MLTNIHADIRSEILSDSSKVFNVVIVEDENKDNICGTFTPEEARLLAESLITMVGVAESMQKLERQGK